MSLRRHFTFHFSFPFRLSPSAAAVLRQFPPLRLFFGLSVCLNDLSQEWRVENLRPFHLHSDFVSPLIGNWNFGSVPQSLGNLRPQQRNSGTAEQWNSGTAEQRNSETAKQRNSGTAKQRNSGASGAKGRMDRGSEDRRTKGCQKSQQSHTTPAKTLHRTTLEVLFSPN